MVVSSLFLLFVILFVFYIFLFIATMSFSGYFFVRSLLPAFPAYLRTYSRFDLVWSRLSCDHGWICSGSINVRQTTNNNNNPPPPQKKEGNRPQNRRFFRQAFVGKGSLLSPHTLKFLLLLLLLLMMIHTFSVISLQLKKLR